MAKQTQAVEVSGVRIGGGSFAIIAGPCGVESRAQLREIARGVSEAGGRLLRAGAFKPRTSPLSFQGLGVEGLRLLREVREEFGLGIVTEAIDVETFDAVEETADMVQIGARNMQNFSLLRRAGRSSRPILLKRGPSATLKEWILSADYILAGGNRQVILCERGIRTFADHCRNTFDLSVIPAARELTGLPIIADPSHACGRRDLIRSMSRAAVAAGADGLIVEVHHNPEEALSDGPQAILPGELPDLFQDAAAIRALDPTRSTR